MLEGLLTILQTLFGWLLYLILSWTLTVVDMLEKMFNIFSGTQTVNYDGESAYLLEIFIGNSAVTNVFWAMAIIGIILSFGFTIVAVARKVTDVTGTTKHTIGQILSQFFKSLLVIVMLNLVVVVSFNVTSVVFDRINFALANSESLSDGYERTYTDEEFAVMTRVLATVGNYSVNPSAESRYNVNACFNAIRGELSTLYLAGCFDYDFNNSSKNETWQSALAKVVKAADLTEDVAYLKRVLNMTYSSTKANRVWLVIVALLSWIIFLLSAMASSNCFFASGSSCSMSLKLSDFR